MTIEERLKKLGQLAFELLNKYVDSEEMVISDRGVGQDELMEGLYKEANDFEMEICNLVGIKIADE